ncbi:hypothetical protein AB0B15_11655 [Streptomyces sp. NPDC045456]|uniref:hypothetical protein n=1 Tax=Streptomyces sp. NPDC045456 TaxID=3155254 RepID=UPI0033E5FF48
MATTLTSNERAARLRAQLSDTPSDLRSAHRLRQSPAANVLIGVTLRAAARRQMGLELTALEQRLTDQLAAVFGTETLEEFGRIYQEPSCQAGAASLFPALVADRPLKEGVETEEVWAFAPTIQSQAADLPGMRQVDVQELGQGVLSGREDVVAVTGAPTAGTEFEVEAVYEARVRFVRFRCDRVSSESGRDEVYWASGAAGDSQAQIVMLTPEYGKIEVGNVRSFGPNAYWFKGAAEKFVGGHIQVWEADPGGNDENKVRQVLADIARDFAVSGLEAGPGWEAVFAGLVAGVAGLVNWIISLNKDDFVADKTVAFTRDALARMSQTNAGQSDLVFDGGGGGKYTLTIEVSFGPVIADGLNHAIYYNGAWSKPVHIPHLVAASRPSMASHNGTLYAVYPDAADAIKLTAYNGENWSEPRTVQDVAGNTVRGRYVAIASHNGSLVTVVAGRNDGNGRTGTITPDTSRLTGYLSDPVVVYTEPTLVSFDGGLFMFRNAVQGSWGIPCFRYDVSDPRRWKHIHDVDAVAEERGVAATVFEGRVWLFYLAEAGQPEPSVKAKSHHRLWESESWLWRTEDHAAFQAPSTKAPTVAVAALGAYDQPKEALFAAYPYYITPGDDVLVTGMHADGVNTFTPTPLHDDGVRKGVSIAAHQGTLHLLYW